MAIDAADGEAWASGGVSDTTNNRMEMQAWVEGLKALHEALGSCDVLVCGDSQYVGLGFENPHWKRDKNRDLWRLIDAAADKHKSVEFVHVKGHSGIQLNELVDELASQARKEHRDAQAGGIAQA